MLPIKQLSLTFAPATLVPIQDNVIGRRDSGASTVADGDIVAAGGVVYERTNTVGRIVAACGVAKERANTVGRVEYAGGVAQDRALTDGRVEAAGSVAKRAHGHPEERVQWAKESKLGF